MGASIATTQSARLVLAAKRTQTRQAGMCCADLEGELVSYEVGILADFSAVPVGLVHRCALPGRTVQYNFSLLWKADHTALGPIARAVSITSAVIVPAAPWRGTGIAAAQLVVGVATALTHDMTTN